ncbi:hypothetical protein HY450_01730 [Candidatus Pacearchaeota archaeon]|nr:hypothetical protein [Candidatus Pacearchaeota archaeon]
MIEDIIVVDIEVKDGIIQQDQQLGGIFFAILTPPIKHPKNVADEAGRIYSKMVGKKMSVRVIKEGGIKCAYINYFEITDENESVQLRTFVSDESFLVIQGDAMSEEELINFRNYIVKPARTNYLKQLLQR